METIRKKSAQHGAYAAILAAAALWGIIGLWNRTLMGAGLSPTGIVAVRNFGGMVLLTTIFAIKDRSVFQVKKAHVKYFFGTGIVSVLLFTICYFSCQKISSLAVASILLYTAPAFVIVLGKEVLMVIGGMFMLNKDVVVYSNMMGKVATCFFIAALTFSFFHAEFAAMALQLDVIFLWISVVLTLCAFVGYAIPAVKVLRGQKK